MMSMNLEVMYSKTHEFPKVQLSLFLTDLLERVLGRLSWFQVDGKHTQAKERDANDS